MKHYIVKSKGVRLSRYPLMTKKDAIDAAVVERFVGIEDAEACLSASHAKTVKWTADELAMALTR